ENGGCSVVDEGQCGRGPKNRILASQPVDVPHGPSKTGRPPPLARVAVETGGYLSGGSNIPHRQAPPEYGPRDPGEQAEIRLIQSRHKASALGRNRLRHLDSEVAFQGLEP